MSTILVSSAIANKPLNGGNAWVILSWLRGFRRLGFDVHFVEQIAPESCVDEAGRPAPFEASANLAYFKRVFDWAGLADSATLLLGDGPAAHGLPYRELLALAEEAELLVNVTGHLASRPILRRVRRKAYVDLDPGFTQFWHAQGSAGPRLAGHDAYYTVGENVGTPACPIPTGNLEWRPIRQPVVLADWPVSDAGTQDLFTTVASWRGAYGRVQHGDTTFGLKVHEFRKLVDVPRRAPGRYEIALDIHPGDSRDLDLLREHGWGIVDPRTVAPDPEGFRDYVRRSGAELSAAQGIYVETESGWFSDRTVRYLAAGKPVIVQDTGFGRTLPVGEGLLAFRTAEEAVAAAADVVHEYDRHARAARAIAETNFDSDIVLRRLLQDLDLAPGAARSREEARL